MADQSLINSARRLYQSKAAASQSMMPYISKKVFGAFEKIINDSNLKFEQNIEKYGIDTGDITPQIAASMGDKGSELIDNQFNDIQELSKPFQSKKKKAEILGRVNQRQANLAIIKKEQEIYDAKLKKIIAKRGEISKYNTALNMSSYADFSEPNSEWNQNIFTELEGAEDRPVGIYTKVDGKDVNVNTLQEPITVARAAMSRMSSLLEKVEKYKQNLKPGDVWEGSKFRSSIINEAHKIISTPEVAGSLAYDGFEGDKINGVSFLASSTAKSNVDMEDTDKLDTAVETLKGMDLVNAYRSWSTMLIDDVFANTQTRPTKPKGGEEKEEEKDLSYIVGALNNKMDFKDPYDRNTKYVYDAKAGKYTTYYYGKPLQDPNFEKTLYIDSLNEFNTLIPGLNYMAKPVEEKENTPYSTSSAARGFNSNLNLPKK